MFSIDDFGKDRPRDDISNRCVDIWKLRDIFDYEWDNFLCGFESGFICQNNGKFFFFYSSALVKRDWNDYFVKFI